MPWYDYPPGPYRLDPYTRQPVNVYKRPTDLTLEDIQAMDDLDLVVRYFGTICEWIANRPSRQATVPEAWVQARLLEQKNVLIAARAFRDFTLAWTEHK